jgi:hypothetical protein
MATDHIPISWNDEIKVTLTEKGEEFYNAFNAELKIQPVPLTEGRKLTMRMYEIAYIFGKSLYHGNPEPLLETDATLIQRY